ncbi:radical SAM protein [Helicobacter didelphidarum]|uniref:Radical SAM protein n=1 Tax=Helicobacter didelphidarum TaxID=2040648 RepID=A0A3D8IPP8_9HELI|nr:radical SAM/SPASM domain-containing protein [Helicobacter didelphidarum]RDU66960.1 radical SAM protein [Helicobacter didelphidarum]
MFSMFSIYKRMTRIGYKKHKGRMREEILRIIDNDSFLLSESSLRTLGGGGETLKTRILELTTPISDIQKQKDILKRNLMLVEIEIASFCNRKCYFCPNSFVDRSNNIELDEGIYLKILGNLKEIDYDKGLNFHRFNEPLANKELILKRVKQARSYLPKARFTIFTNGDYLTREYLDLLADAGINNMIMSYYFPKTQEFDRLSLKDSMQKMGKKLGLESTIIQDDNARYALRLIYESINITYQAWNPKEIACSRASSVKVRSSRAKPNLESSCYQSSLALYIDYNGLMMPCCNTRSDVDLHKDMILGDLQKGDVFSLFFSEHYTNMRRQLLFQTPQICNDCSDRWKNLFNDTMTSIYLND